MRNSGVNNTQFCARRIIVEREVDDSTIRDCERIRAFIQRREINHKVDVHIRRLVCVPNVMRTDTNAEKVRSEILSDIVALQ